MDMTITFPGGKKVDAQFGAFTLKTDQPPSGGGEGSAPEPFSLFLASLGTCAGIYVLSFCQKRGISTEGLSLTQHNTFDPETRALKDVRLELNLPVGFPEKYVDAVRAAADGCKVKKTLAAPPHVEVVSVPARSAA